MLRGLDMGWRGQASCSAGRPALAQAQRCCAHGARSLHVLRAGQLIKPLLSRPLVQVEQLETEQQVPAAADQGGVIPFMAPPLTDSPPPPRATSPAPTVRARV